MGYQSHKQNRAKNLAPLKHDHIADKIGRFLVQDVDLKHQYENGGSFNTVNWKEITGGQYAVELTAAKNKKAIDHVLLRDMPPDPPLASRQSSKNQRNQGSKVRTESELTKTKIRRKKSTQ
jgi:hypothetical protein